MADGVGADDPNGPQQLVRGELVVATLLPDRRYDEVLKYFLHQELHFLFAHHYKCFRMFSIFKQYTIVYNE